MLHSLSYTASLKYMRGVGLVVCKRIKTIVCGCSDVQLSCRKRLLACNRAWSVEQPWWLVVEARCRSAIPFACRATWTVTRRHKPTRNPAQSSSRATGLNNSSTYTCNPECNHPFLIISRSISAILCSKDSNTKCTHHLWHSGRNPAIAHSGIGS